MLTLRKTVASAATLLLTLSTRASAQLIAATGAPLAGLSCDQMEGNRLHIHQHLAIFDRGKPIAIPADVGQIPAKRCLYWLHTHTPDGIVHIEAPQDRTFTLGDFFTIWGQTLSRTQAAGAHAAKGQTLTVWVNGKKFTGDPRTIPLVAHADIVIQAGKPNALRAPFTAWNGQ